MCGITGYIGRRSGLPVVIENLKKLEYRGYDSAGTAFFSSAHNRPSVELVKAVGKLDNLETLIKDRLSPPGMGAIAHTRWATHGVPNERNAHPHHDCGKKIFLVHNGIIENYKPLKKDLERRGHRFRSETDTEVIAHLIEETESHNGADFIHTLEKSLSRLLGAYALVIVNAKEPNSLYAARLGSPLVIGVGEKEYFIASDPTALAGLVKRVIYLDDRQIAKLSPDGFTITPSKIKLESLDLDAETAKKGRFPDFMLKEIYEGPEVVEAALRGRLRPDKQVVKLGGLESVTDKLKRIRQAEIFACGTSYYAGMIGEMLFEEIADMPTEIKLASEYRYQETPTRKNTAAFFISQSGETADTLAALRKAKAKKTLTLGIVNAVGSSIARETASGVYNHAGPEIGVASTKAFLSQVAVLNLVALFIRQGRSEKFDRHRKALLKIPDKIRKILTAGNAVKNIAKRYADRDDFLFLGRGYNYPVALEGALKLKEISYAHAEGYSAAEMKHGPIALIEPGFPVIVIATKNKLYEKTISNIEEVKARGASVIAVATEGDKNIAEIATDVIYIPETIEPLEPLLTVVPLQLFAYYTAKLRGLDVDRPRNLAKSVTVE